LAGLYETMCLCSTCLYNLQRRIRLGAKVTKGEGGEGKDIGRVREGKGDSPL